MTIHLNGTPTELSRSNTVAEMLTELTLPAATLLVEHNGIALHRRDWPTTPLTEGDRLELLRITAGG